MESIKESACNTNGEGASEARNYPVPNTGKYSRSRSNRNVSTNLLKKPLKPSYTCLQTPYIQPYDKAYDYKADSMCGFAEFRKYKKANEPIRIITPYVSEEAVDQSLPKQQENIPEIQIADPRNFLLAKIEPIPVLNLRSLKHLVCDNSEIGFVTMNREHMDLVNDYNPYQYTICHYNDIDKLNYVSISPNGLVEFYKDDADFLPLDRLEMEQEIYLRLKEIPSFQNFRMWKTFMVWLSKIRRRKFMNAKEKLEAFFIEKYENYK